MWTSASLPGTPDVHWFMSKPPADVDDEAAPMRLWQLELPDYHRRSLSMDDIFAGIGNEKDTMRQLNKRLTTYVQKVKKLQAGNSKLQMKIHEARLKSGLEEEDFDHYESIIENLRKEVLANIIANARIVLNIENKALILEDFKNKYHIEHNFCKAVEADNSRMKKFIDDNTVKCFSLESDVEQLTKDIIHLKKTHKEERLKIREEITKSMVEVKVNGPVQPDLEEIMAEMRAKYEKIIQKNKEELKLWYQNQMSEIQKQLTEKTKALRETKVQLTEQRRREQTIQIELQTWRGQICALESSLTKVQQQRNFNIESWNADILHLEEAIATVKSNAKAQQERYTALLHLKMKLEEEIETYRRILGELSMDQQLTEKKSVEMTKEERTEWERKETERRETEGRETEGRETEGREWTKGELEKKVIIEKKLIKVIKEFIGGELVNEVQETEQLGSDEIVESEQVQS